MKGIIISAVKSGSGKTMATLVIMKLLTTRGMKVAPFKTGPDFIDPSHYGYVCGVPGRNLDSFMMDDTFITWNLGDGLRDRNCAVIEGVMGLFDGYGEEGRGSTAELAKKLKLPVILLVDAKGMSQSILPLIHGFLDWDRAVSIRGVILNKVNSESNYQLLRKKIEKLGVRCLGYIPTLPELEVKERHLGIAMGHERGREFEEGLRKASETLDAEGIAEIVSRSERKLPHAALEPAFTAPLTIAVARDEAFCFLYHENIELFKIHGACIRYFSPLTDSEPGEADLIYLPGGYPELYAKQLAGNRSMLAAIRKYSTKGRPMLAECGGFMYLCKTLDTGTGRYAGAGVFPFTVVMGKRFSSLGYVEVVPEEGNPLFEPGTALKGHRFHYSRIEENGKTVPLTYRILRKGKEEWEGYTSKNTVGSYVHLHFGSNVAAVGRLFERVMQYKQSTTGVRTLDFK